MANQTCENCALRAKHDSNSKSFAGLFWRLHINFCPGWKKYFTGLSPEKKAKVAEQYHFKKYQ